MQSTNPAMNKYSLNQLEKVELKYRNGTKRQLFIRSPLNNEVFDAVEIMAFVRHDEVGDVLSLALANSLSCCASASQRRPVVVGSCTNPGQDLARLHGHRLQHIPHKLFFSAVGLRFVR